MTADCPEDFPYERAESVSDPKVRASYWSVASGLQAVDELAPSAYMQAVAQDYIEGKRSVAEMNELVKVYYREKSAS